MREKTIYEKIAEKYNTTPEEEQMDRLFLEIEIQ